MPRRKSMSSIDAEISALKDKISATKTRYENLCRDLEKLQQEREMVFVVHFAVFFKNTKKRGYFAFS